MLPDRVFSSGGSAGPSTATQTIVGSSPATQASGELILIGSGRSTDATPFMLVSVPLSATGESITLEGSVQCHTEGTHEHHAVWHIVGSGRRTNAGVSARTSNAGGGGAGQTANTFMGPKPALSVSDPSSAVAPNVMHRQGLVGTGKAGVNILWEYNLRTTDGKVI